MNLKKVKEWYNCWHMVWWNFQTKQGQTGNQQQKRISRNHVPAITLFPVLADIDSSLCSVTLTWQGLSSSTEHEHLSTTVLSKNCSFISYINGSVVVRRSCVKRVRRQMRYACSTKPCKAMDEPWLTYVLRTVLHRVLYDSHLLTFVISG